MESVSFKDNEKHIKPSLIKKTLRFLPLFVLAIFFKGDNKEIKYSFDAVIPIDITDNKVPKDTFKLKKPILSADSLPDTFTNLDTTLSPFRRPSDSAQERVDNLEDVVWSGKDNLLNDSVLNQGDSAKNGEFFAEEKGILIIKKTKSNENMPKKKEEILNPEIVKKELTVFLSELEIEMNTFDRKDFDGMEEKKFLKYMKIKLKDESLINSLVQTATSFEYLKKVNKDIINSFKEGKSNQEVNFTFYVFSLYKAKTFGKLLELDLVDSFLYKLILGKNLNQEIEKEERRLKVFFSNKNNLEEEKTKLFGPHSFATKADLVDLNLLSFIFSKLKKSLSNLENLPKTQEEFLFQIDIEKSKESPNELLIILNEILAKNQKARDSLFCFLSEFEKDKKF